jgi:NAD(P)-dependent dehydrogenase (short-subunit alcohol dehydrogenase family)
VAADQWSPPDLKGKVALVAGATRGAGRGIAVALGQCGATVWCSGRSVKGAVATPGRPETIDETAALVTAAGGHGVAAQCDHTDAAQVGGLRRRIENAFGRLDVLVNDVWGGDALVNWGEPFWENDLGNVTTLLDRAVKSHVITAHTMAPMLLETKGTVFEVTDGTEEHNREYRGNLHYDLVKTTVNRLMFGMAHDLRPHGVAALGITPGFLRSEAMLAHFGVSEGRWRDAVAKDPFFAASETPAYVGRAVATLAAAPDRMARSGKVWGSWQVAEEAGFTDVDGRRPHLDRDFAAIRAGMAVG